jgi:hypothetical protein
MIKELHKASGNRPPGKVHFMGAPALLVQFEPKTAIG